MTLGGIVCPSSNNLVHSPFMSITILGLFDLSEAMIVLVGFLVPFSTRFFAFLTVWQTKTKKY